MTTYYDFAKKFNTDIPELYCTWTQTTLKFFRKYADGSVPKRWRKFEDCSSYVSYDKVFLIQLRDLDDGNYPVYVEQIRRNIVGVDMGNYDADCRRIEDYLATKGLRIDFDNAKSVKVFYVCPDDLAFMPKTTVIDNMAKLEFSLKSMYSKLLLKLSMDKCTHRIVRDGLRDRVIRQLREVISDDDFHKNMVYKKNVGYAHKWMASPRDRTTIRYQPGICSKMADVVRVMANESVLSNVVKQYIAGSKVITL